MIPGFCMIGISIFSLILTGLIWSPPARQFNKKLKLNKINSNRKKKLNKLAILNYE